VVTPEQDVGPDPDERTAELVDLLRGGDPHAGTLLDELYRERILRFCWGYLGRMDEAEDAVQDVCFRILNTTTVPDAFRPWLYKIARNQCRTLIRRRTRRRQEGHGLPPASQILELLTGQLTRLLHEEEQSRVEELVRRLSADQQEVLRLRYVEDLPRTEIAEVLDLPESVVKSRLFEGLKRLRADASVFDES